MGPLTLGDVTMDLALKAHLSPQREVPLEVGEEVEGVDLSTAYVDCQTADRVRLLGGLGPQMNFPTRLIANKLPQP